MRTAGPPQRDRLVWLALALSVALHLLLSGALFAMRFEPAQPPEMVLVRLGLYAAGAGQGGSSLSEDGEEEGGASLPAPPLAAPQETRPPPAALPPEERRREEAAPVPRPAPSRPRPESGRRQNTRPAVTPAGPQSLARAEAAPAAAEVMAEGAGRGNGQESGQRNALAGGEGRGGNAGAAGGGALLGLGSPGGPAIIRIARPEYPEEARRQSMSGTVRLVFTLSGRGRVSDISVAQSAGPLLDEAARKALRASRFRPAQSAAGPVPCVTTYSFIFTLR